MKEFLKMYHDLNKDNLQILATVYTDNVQFVDPAHEIYGLDKLFGYFAKLYRDVESIHFSFHDVLEGEGSGYVQWDMTFSHKKFAGGRPITVAGVTFVRIDESGKVFYHRDYFDLGTLVYEQVPILGRLIRSIKGRLGK